MRSDELKSLLDLAARIEEAIGDLYLWFARNLSNDRRARRFFTRMGHEERAHHDAFRTVERFLPATLEIDDQAVPDALKDGATEMRAFLQEVTLTRSIAEKRAFDVHWATQVAQALEASEIEELMSWLFRLPVDPHVRAQLAALSANRDRHLDQVNKFARGLEKPATVVDETAQC